MDFESYLARIDLIVKFMESRSIASMKCFVDGNPVDICLSQSKRPQPAVSVESISPVEQIFSAKDGVDICSCGHSWLEHSESGCFHGCSHELCLSESSDVASKQ